MITVEEHQQLIQTWSPSHSPPVTLHSGTFVPTGERTRRPAAPSLPQTSEARDPPVRTTPEGMAARMASAVLDASPPKFSFPGVAEE